MTKSDSKSPNAGAITEQARAPAKSGQDGTKPSSHGSSVAPARLSRVDRAMAGTDQREVMRAIADGLPESLQTSLEALKQIRMDETWGTDVEFKGLDLVNRAMMPASSREISVLLSELRAQCRTRGGESTGDIVFQISVYARKLEDWPADVVRMVLRCWPEDRDFWPTWHELRDAMEPYTERRRGLVECMQAALDRQMSAEH